MFTLFTIWLFVPINPELLNHHLMGRVDGLEAPPRPSKNPNLISKDVPKAQQTAVLQVLTLEYPVRALL
ncbi:MAG: hypothetical protein C4331_05590 [Meiothermus sp.]